MSKFYITDRVMHWFAALMLLFMLMNLSSQLHNVDWDIKGQLLHRQSAVELHATVGIILLLVTLARVFYPYFISKPLPRTIPSNKKHAVFIRITHIALYACIGALGVTGLAMLVRYEIPLSVLGVALEPSKDAFYAEFPSIHQIHMQLQRAVWWLVGIHFVGIIAAKR